MPSVAAMTTNSTPPIHHFFSDRSLNYPAASHANSHRPSICRLRMCDVTFWLVQKLLPTFVDAKVIGLPFVFRRSRCRLIDPDPADRIDDDIFLLVLRHQRQLQIRVGKLKQLGIQP